jgi:hypothetical protein
MQILSAPFAGVTGDYQSIATVTVGVAGQATVTFSSIPSTFKHLQIRAIGRTSRISTNATIYLQLNSDTASNYSNHNLIGDGASASSDGAGSRTPDFIAACVAGGTLATANSFGVAVIDILDYANTDKYKTIRSLTGRDFNGSGDARLASANWRNTNAITTIELKDSSGANIAQYSSFALYGIRG